VDEPFPPRAEPTHLEGAESPGLEEGLPGLGTPIGAWDRHRAVVPVGVQPAVQQVQAEALQPGAEHRFDDDEPAPGDPEGFVQDRLGRRGVVQREQDERGVERPVSEGEPRSVVGHVRSGHAPERADVHGACPDPRPRAQRGGDVSFARPEVQQPRAD